MIKKSDLDNIKDIEFYDYEDEYYDWVNFRFRYMVWVDGDSQPTEWYDDIDELNSAVEERQALVDEMTAGKPPKAVKYLLETDGNDSVVDFLAEKFKKELAIVCKENSTPDNEKRFAFNEDDELFIPLRKYYATAVRYTMENFDPKTDKNYILLCDKFGRTGLEYLYYQEILVEKIIDEVYDKFFIDYHHPALYNMKDSRYSYSLTDMSSGKYGYLSMITQIKDAIGIENEKDKMFDDVIDESFASTGLDEIYRPKWNDDVNSRLKIIFSKLSEKYIKDEIENSKRIQELSNEMSSRG